MTTRGRWDETRSPIEAGWRSARCGWCGENVAHPCYVPGVMPLLCRHWTSGTAAVAIDWDDTKQAQHDGSRQIYGGLGTPQREDD